MSEQSSHQKAREDHWEAVHTTKVMNDVSWWQDADALWIDLVTGLSVPRDAAVIDVGSGSGMLADTLLEAGYTNVTVCDISAASLQRVNERLADRVQYLVGDVTNLESGRTYDVWFDRAVFHFLTKEDDIAAYRDSLMKHTSPGAFAIIATFAEDGPEQCSGLDVHRYTQGALADTFAPEWHLIHSERRIHTTPWASEQPFSIVVLQRD